MSGRSSQPIFVTPAPGEAESSQMAEIRAEKRPADATIKTEEPPAQRPRLIAGSSAATVIVIDDDADNDNDEENQILVDIEHIDRKKIPKDQVLPFVQEELGKVYERRAREAVPGSRLSSTLEDIRVLIQHSPKTKIMKRYRNSWKRILTRAKIALSEELDRTESAMEVLERDDDVEVIDRQVLKRMKLRLKRAEVDAKKAEDLVAFLEGH
ncbi:Hypothetical predicted protein [Lecanosticta acicola]|uniref:Uncharacterized protein n=1 Tax=Lecanosticta acicola TaxID=111012 RepID=A0AAI9E986_9PEZI|nr:Hypothetical predicted protein [Lecanosticta acicola]